MDLSSKSKRLHRGTQKIPESIGAQLKKINLIINVFTIKALPPTADIVLALLRKVDGGLQLVIFSPVVKLVLQPYDLLQLPDLSVCFVAD